MRVVNQDVNVQAPLNIASCMWYGDRDVGYLDMYSEKRISVISNYDVLETHNGQIN